MMKTSHTVIRFAHEDTRAAGEWISCVYGMMVICYSLKGNGSSRRSHPHCPHIEVAGQRRGRRGWSSCLRRGRGPSGGGSGRGGRRGGRSPCKFMEVCRDLCLIYFAFSCL